MKTLLILTIILVCIQSIFSLRIELTKEKIQPNSFKISNLTDVNKKCYCNNNIGKRPTCFESYKFFRLPILWFYRNRNSSTKI